MSVRDTLAKLRDGLISIEDAERAVRTDAELNLGFARLDVDRERRRGMAEVIYCAGKTAAQIIDIVSAMKKANQNVLGTRIAADVAAAVRAVHPEAVHHEAARCITVEVKPRPAPVGLVTVITAGTSDLPVAEEAALTAEWLGAKVERVFDCGVAGLHRLMPHLPLLRSSRAVIVIAGMEGALPSVVGGLIDKPLVAVPTSIGYGMNFGGLTALLAMLNTCAPGVSVVNVDNGFGAGVCASLINRVGERT